MAMMIIMAVATMVLLALAFSLVLGWANVKFRVEQDPRIGQVEGVVPGANCGGCGYAGCADFARAVVAGEAPPDGCPVGGADVAHAIAEILGITVDGSAPYRPVVHCAADYDDRLQRCDYRGEPTCFAANVIGGVQGCTYGCLGFGDCVKACDYDAIHVVNGLAVVDYEKCIGCGACERACPRHIISMVPFKTDRIVVVACSNHDSGRQVKEVCKVGCIGCKGCEKAMAGVFTVKDNLAEVDYDKVDKDTDFTPALKKCPMGAMLYVGKPTEKDKADVAGEELPAVVTDQFETTADKADWRG
ncbi:MAG: RnfABCDGE type electron transport complex subunit B [Planctomycetes bacterium]|nr:RnfABCDGE type electron transport complex subunit B [Planctomycetota bacterium]